MEEQTSVLQKAKDFVADNWSTIRWFIVVLLIVVGAALFALWNASRAQRYSADELAGIQRLVVFAGKSAREAQKTQQNTLQSLLHTIYALCFINSAKHMVGGMDALQKLTPVNIKEMHQYLTTSQMKLLSRIQQQCTANSNNNILESALQRNENTDVGGEASDSSSLSH